MSWYHYVKIAIIAICIYLFLTYKNTVFSFLSGNESLIAIGANTATILGAFFGVITLFFILVQLVSDSKQAKRVRTYELITKYYSSDFYQYIYDALLLLTSKQAIDGKIEILFDSTNAEHKNYRMKCSSLFMFFEDMCLMYNEKLIDQYIFEEAFGHVAPSLYYDSQDIVHRYRAEEDDQEVCKNWELCARKLNKKLSNKFEFKPSAWDAHNI